MNRVAFPRRRLAWALTIAAAVAMAVADLPAQADRGAYTIRSSDIVLTVEPDADLLVEERLEVVFSEPRHGIFRTIPVRYTDPHGFAYSLGFRLIEVVDDDGNPHRTDVSNEGRYVRVRIGDPDREVSGTVSYIIRYRVRDALSQFGEYDEIYWNATGHEWNAAIERATATVRLPAAIDRGDLRAAAYTGRFGDTGRDVTVTYPEPGEVRFTTTRRLEPLEGLTVAVGFPSGLVAFPSAAARAGRLAADNWVALLPLAWLLFLIRRWRAVGRDPDAGDPVVVTYEPPPGLRPGGIGTLVDERVDAIDLTATIVDLAVRGYLTIRTEREERLLGLLESEDTVFQRTDGDAGALLAHERLLLAALFSSGDEVRASALKNRFYRHLPAIRRALYARLTEEGHFERSPESTRHRWMGLGLAAGVVTGLLARGWFAYRGVGPPADVLIPIATGILTTVVFWLFARAMPRRTSRGVAARRWALGFEEFVTRVEADRLAETLADPRSTFETLLPYAMALGVAGEWAERFEDLYRDRQPGWYSGPSTSRGFSTIAFERQLSGAMAATSRSMTASPRGSSGSGGGGSSGGGGGGGGGGSW